MRTTVIGGGSKLRTPASIAEWVDGLREQEAARLAVSAVREAIERLALRPDNDALVPLLWTWSHRLDDVRGEADSAVLARCVASAATARDRLASMGAAVWTVAEADLHLSRLSSIEDGEACRRALVRLALTLAVASVSAHDTQVAA
jgi:hypothetical protein